MPNDPFESLLRDPTQGRHHIESVLKVVPLPENKAALQREIRFSMAYCQANRLSQTAKWLGELLVTVQAGASLDSKSGNPRAKQGRSSSNADDQVMNGDHMAPNEVFSSQIVDQDLPGNSRQASSSSFSKVFYERPSEAQDRLNLSRTLFDLKEY